MRVFRIVKAKYADSCLEGRGARDYGGRWNSKGRAVVYTGSSIALCTLEMLVHIHDIGLLRLAYRVMELDVPDSWVKTIDSSMLPKDWTMPEHPECKRVGDEWLGSGGSAALRVPSAVVPMEHNVLLNPAHPDFEKIKSMGSRPIAFDPRLMSEKP
jgi:RES domain-containing protein